MPKANLPEQLSLEHLKKLAQSRLQELKGTNPGATLAAGQLEVARTYGFPSWRALKAQVEGWRAKKIVSPAMRFLAVADVNRSVAFYRDVLGFEGSGNEVSLGPARIRFGAQGYAAADWNCENLRPPGSGIVFLQTEDVAATHAGICARGGAPSGIEAVNWIKMRMFEVRDPDGNVLWFGQSYHKEQASPSRRREQPLGIRRALPELPFNDVPAAVAYYRDVLGFRINYQQEDLGVMDRDEITVLLIARTAAHTGIGSFGTYVSDADALYEELLSRGATVLGPPVSYPWGLRNFQVLDPEGNRITFSQTFE